MRHIRRRPAYFQAALTLVALLSAVLLGGVQEASCAMHGLGAARSESVAPAGMSHTGHAPATSHERGRHSHGSGDSGCDCSCIGACTIVAPLATPRAVVTLRIALIDPEPRRPLDTEPALAPPVEPDRLLPFANGPPASALV
ncbi:MAG: hypothetical protein ACJ79A_18720 [Gemmatimonadaceae bacterium]